MDLGLFSRMVVLQSATVLGWEVAKAVLEVYMVQVSLSLLLLLYIPLEIRS